MTHCTATSISFKGFGAVTMVLWAGCLHMLGVSFAPHFWERFDFFKCIHYYIFPPNVIVGVSDLMATNSNAIHDEPLKLTGL